MGALLVALIVLHPPVHETDNSFGQKENTNTGIHYTITAASGTIVLSQLERFSHSTLYLKKNFTDRLVFKSLFFDFKSFSNCQSVQPQYRNDNALSLLVYKCVLRI
jgi:hypothetical protein